MRHLSDNGKLALACWYAGHVRDPRDMTGLKSIYLRTQRLLEILDPSCSTVTVRLSADLSKSGQDEYFVIETAVHTFRLDGQRRAAADHASREGGRSQAERAAA